MYLVNLTGTLRVSASGEVEGLDLHEHGAAAYPEYVVHGNDGTPKSLKDLKPVTGGANMSPSPTTGDD
jgi:hypothetical protein